jgi:hypothetical protein
MHKPKTKTSSSTKAPFDARLALAAQGNTRARTQSKSDAKSDASADRPRPVALVTGASAGLGRAFCLALAERGYDLVITARREDRLLTLKKEVSERFGARAMVIAEDLALPSAPRTICEIIRSSELEIEMLVNNAGYGVRGRFLDVEWSTHADFLQVMTISWLQLTHTLLPGMIARKRGRILNVSSLAALGPEPPGSLYSPTKYLMASASRALRLNLMGTGVHCTALCPGFTHTEFHDVLGCRAGMNTLPRFMWQQAPVVVEAGLRGVERNRAVVVPGLFNTTAAFMCKILPYALTSRLIPKAVLEEHSVAH